MPKTSNTIFSCALSYVYLSLIAFLRNCFEIFANVSDTAIVNSCISIFLGAIFAIAVALIFSTNWFSKLTVSMFQKTIHEHIWDDVFDMKNGSNLKVFLKDSNYFVYGHYFSHDEAETWIAIAAFAKYDKNTEKLLDGASSYSDNKDAICVIRFSDIEHIEVL